MPNNCFIFQTQLMLESIMSLHEKVCNQHCSSGILLGRPHSLMSITQLEIGSLLKKKKKKKKKKKTFIKFYFLCFKKKKKKKKNLEIGRKSFL
jgi:hypothetical protein